MNYAVFAAVFVVLLLAAYVSSVSVRARVKSLFTAMAVRFRQLFSKVKDVAGHCPHCHIKRDLEVFEDKVIAVCPKCRSGHSL